MQNAHVHFVPSYAIDCTLDISMVGSSEFGLNEALKKTLSESKSSEYDLGEFKGHYVVRRGNNLYLPSDASQVVLTYQYQGENFAEIQLDLPCSGNQISIPASAVPGHYAMNIDGEDVNCSVYKCEE